MTKGDTLTEIRKVTNETNDVEVVDKTPESDIQKRSRRRTRGRHASQRAGVVSGATLSGHDLSGQISEARTKRRLQLADDISDADITRLTDRPLPSPRASGSPEAQPAPQSVGPELLSKEETQ